MPSDTATKLRATGTSTGVDYAREWQRGRLHIIDQISNGDSDHLGPALKVYADTLNKNRQSLHWQRAVKWVENIFFSAGRQYIDDILVSRLANSSTNSIGNLSIVQESIRNLPKPTNDLLGRYLETNIALLTENRPRPRVTPKSDRDEDKTAAELSELTLEYLWEVLKMPEKTREICRFILNTGVCWLEVVHDPLQSRYMSVPETEEAPQSVFPEGLPGAPGVPTKAVRQVTKFDPKTGKPIYKEDVSFGDLVANIVSPFSFHIPSTHTWNSEEMGWVMKEEFVPIDVFKDRVLYAAKHKSSKGKLGKRQGWHLENLDKIQMENAQSLPMWWYERITELVEGPGPSIYIGSPDYWEGYVVVRTFDRKPNPKWPKGRTVVTAGDQLIYDSPKDVGARAYDPRWPSRWHPYIRFRWEGQVGCFVPGTPIILDDGSVKPIENIVVGDVVSAKEGNCKITNKFVYDHNKLCKIVKVNGLLPVTVTDYHKLPVLRKKVFDNKVKPGSTKTYQYSKLTLEDIEEISIGDLKVGDFILTGFKRPRYGADKIDISKYVISPSHWRNKNKLAPGFKPIPPIVSLDKNTLRLLGLYLAEGSKAGSCNTKFSFSVKEKDTLVSETINLLEHIFGKKAYTSVGSGGMNVLCSSTQLQQLFDILVGGHAKDKKIHVDLFTSSKSLLPLVGGWIDGDGSSWATSTKGKTHKKSEAVTTSKQLAYQIYNILLDERIPTRIKFDKTVNSYRLYWDTEARQMLAPYCNKFKLDTSQKTARQGFWLGENFLRRIKKIEDSEIIEKVYDLEVDKEHHYKANGIVVHNSVYGRSLLSKLLPKLKRINSIDTALIMWRRTVPIAAWSAPKGSHVVEDIWTGRPGGIWEWDARQTNGSKPEPIYPPDFPKGMLEERQQQIVEMESISGTEQILRGERPVGVNSAAMIDILRKQALASRSSILQSWDEGLQEIGTSFLQEIIRHVGDNEYMAERLRILAREKQSRISIDTFAGTDLSDNVNVRVDTVSMALVSKEAREAKMIEILQYLPNLQAIEDQNLRMAILEELGIAQNLKPSGPDIDRVEKMISWIKQKKFEFAIPMVEDDPYIFHSRLVAEKKNEGFFDLDGDQQQYILRLIKEYRDMIIAKEAQIMESQMAMMKMQQGGAVPNA